MSMQSNFKMYGVAVKDGLNKIFFSASGKDFLVVVRWKFWKDILEKLFKIWFSRFIPTIVPSIRLDLISIRFSNEKVEASKMQTFNL